MSFLLDILHTINVDGVDHSGDISDISQTSSSTRVSFLIKTRNNKRRNNFASLLAAAVPLEQTNIEARMSTATASVILNP